MDMFTYIGGASPIGQIEFIQTAPGVTTQIDWVVPAGVTSICIVAVGPGAAGEDNVGLPPGDGGGGGALVWRNNAAVTPGSTLRARIANTLYADIGILSGATLLRADAASGTTRGDLAACLGYDGGYSGGNAVGQRAGNAPTYGGTAGVAAVGYGGSGINLLGINSHTTGSVGVGEDGGDGANYGGGGEGADGNGDSANTGGQPGLGAVRVIWGPGRAFPSTNTGDM